eukprot:155675_1
MRKIFFTDELKDIPKIFLIDACRTDDAKDEEAQTSPHTPRSHPVATFSSTLMSSEGHKVHGAKICKFVTAELGDSYDNHRLPDFRTVYTAARTKIKQSTNNGQDLVLCEHNLDIDSVIFMPSDEARGSRRKRYDADSKQIAR